MAESLDTYAKYPFLSGARKHVESLGLSLSELAEHSIYSASVEAGRMRVVDALNNKLQATLGEGIELEINILSYPIARVIANLIGGNLALKRYARGEAERAYAFFRKEGKDVLGDVKADLSFPVKDGVVDFRDYLTLSTGLARHNHRWKLVDRILDKGVVKLSDAEELLLLREAVRIRVSEPLNVKNAPKKLTDIAEKIKSSTGFAETRITAKDLEGKELPPCIRHMLSVLEAGDASHNVMFILGTYFISLGLSVDEVVELFRCCPAFSEDKTRYQLEFLAGEKGSIKYSCPSCSKIKSYGLCEWECGITHPLQHKNRG